MGNDKMQLRFIQNVVLSNVTGVSAATDKDKTHSVTKKPKPDNKTSEADQ